MTELKEIKVASTRLKSEQSQPLILVAEDNPDNIYLLRDYLSYLDYQVIIASTGKEAITLAQTEHPQLILMDIQMPEMNGIEAIQYIRFDENCSNIPIIALTALAMPGDLERCLSAGADDYLAKPFSLQALKTTLQQWL